MATITIVYFQAFQQFVYAADMHTHTHAIHLRMYAFIFNDCLHKIHFRLHMHRCCATKSHAHTQADLKHNKYAFRSAQSAKG